MIQDTGYRIQDTGYNIQYTIYNIKYTIYNIQNISVIVFEGDALFPT